MSAPSPAVPRPSPWLLDPVRDLVLYIGTPLLILPVFLGIEGLVASAAIHATITAFGAMGHHLPGMLRAYGDRRLFARFRARFLVAPLVLATLCIAFALRGSPGMVLIAYVWGIWHGFMQTYGFLRIYDARVLLTAKAVARADFAMCAVWFGGAVLLADTRVHYVQRMVTTIGFAPWSPATVATIRTVAIAALGVTTLAYLLVTLRQQRRGHPVSPAKLLLLTTSIGWWWYANLAVPDLLLGLVLFEVFHDVQYLSIVWNYNCARAATDPGVGGFTRFVFRRSWGLLALYLALVFAYGGLGPLAERVLDSESAVAIASALITTSALLHFYFDGFIWKIREDATRLSLGLAGTGLVPRVASGHAAKWLGVVAPALLLWSVAPPAATTGVERARALATATPGSVDAWFELGVALRDAGQPAAAVEAFEHGLTILPRDPRCRDNLAIARLEAGRAAFRDHDDVAARTFLVPLRVDHAAAAAAEVQTGFVAWREGRTADAIVHLRTGLAIDDTIGEGHLNLALALRDSGALEEALAHARRGTALRPTDARAGQLVDELIRRLGTRDR